MNQERACDTPHPVTAYCRNAASVTTQCVRTVTQSPRTAALVACDSIVIPGKCHDPVHSHSHPVTNELGRDVQTASQSGVRTPRCDDWVNVLGHQVVPTSRQHPGGAHPVPDVLGRGTRRGRLGEVECAYRPSSFGTGLHSVTCRLHRRVACALHAVMTG